MTLREAIEKFEHTIISVIEGRCRRRRDRVLRGILFALSRLYGSLVQFRLMLYRNRIIRQRMLGCLVISIGNITVGGTGKTPVVERFSKTLLQKGRRVAILSRGYRSKSQPFLQKLRHLIFRTDKTIPPRVVSDGQRLLMDSRMAGDEPYMLATNLPEAIMLVDKDRVKSGRFAIQRMAADTLILDDGFQYLPLKPTVHIVLVDSTDPFTNHHLLPRGLLREPIRNLKRANYVFLTKSSGNSNLRHLKDFIHHHNPRADIIECSHKPLYLENVYTQERLELNFLQNQKIAAISAIAAPESFKEGLSKLGAELVYAESFIDHHQFRQQELINFLNAAISHGAKAVVTTEKDAVRYPKLDRRDIPLYFLRVEIDILSGYKSFQEGISRICFS